jgi:hypothetical protein
MDKKLKVKNAKLKINHVFSNLLFGAVKGGWEVPRGSFERS